MYIDEVVPRKQRLQAMEAVMKGTPMCWWAMRKDQFEKLDVGSTVYDSSI